MPLTEFERNLLIETHQAVRGDGTDKNPGLVGRVDRLEQKAKFNSWMAKSAIGCFITAAGIWLAEKWKGAP